MKAELCEFAVNPGLHSETSSPGGKKKGKKEKKYCVFKLRLALRGRVLA